MPIVAVGCNHSSASLSLLGRLSIPAGDLPDKLSRLRGIVRAGLILSTCNRTEIYAVTGHAGSGAELLLRFLGDEANVSQQELHSAAYSFSQDDAVSHLMRVASGLDSMVLGEDQIQAQLKRAVAAARAAGALGPVLDRLATSALACGKRVRSFTGIGHHAVSLESLAMRVVQDNLGTLAGRNVLVLGAGESARLIVQQLRGTDARVTILSRRPERALALARAAGDDARSGTLAGITPALAGAEVVFCCSSARQPIVTSDIPVRSGLICVDLGMPRDVEPAVAELPGVTLITLDELSRVAAEHRAARAEHVSAAESIVSREAARFVEWQRARGSAATIAKLRAHAQATADAEFARALARLSGDAARDRALLAELANRIVAKLMHAPTRALKNHPEADSLAVALTAAFGLAAGDALDAGAPIIPGASDEESPSTIEEVAS